MEISARLTSKGQVTVPRAVRKALSLEEGIASSSAWKAITRSWPGPRIFWPSPDS